MNLTTVALALALAAGGHPAPGLAERVAAQAERDPALAGTKVDVWDRDGAVVLRGTVRLYDQKLRWERVAWHTPGAIDVENEIRVVPVTPLGDDAITKAIIGIAAESPRLHGTGLEPRVDRGAVRIRGAFHDAADVLFLKHRVAEIEGVVSIEIDATLPA